MACRLKGFLLANGFYAYTLPLTHETAIIRYFKQFSTRLNHVPGI